MSDQMNNVSRYRASIKKLRDISQTPEEYGTPLYLVIKTAPKCIR